MHRGRGSAARILWCSELASRQGVYAGQTLAAARAHVASLRSHALDPRRLERARRAVVATLLRVTPRIQGDGAERFWAEPVRRYGEQGERPLERWANDASELLAPLEPVSIGVGPTATVAYAAARLVGRGVRLALGEDADVVLHQSAVEVLELDGETVSILASLGIRTVAQLLEHDPASLGMRFGPAVAEAHRRAQGIDPRGPVTVTPASEPSVHLALDDPLDSLDAIVFLLGPACERLVAERRASERAVVRAELTLTHVRYGGVERAPTCVPVRAGAPIDDARSLLELFRIRLERVTLDAPVCALTLRIREDVAHARRTAPMPHGPPPEREGAREVALERLQARLGPESVRRATRVERGHLGERARWMVRLDSPAASTEPVPGEVLPWRRVDPPVPVRDGAVVVAGRRRRVLRLSRVERAQSAWWGDADANEVELLAWAELEGPLLALVRARFGPSRDHWEVIGWLD